MTTHVALYLCYLKMPKSRISRYHGYRVIKPNQCGFNRFERWYKKGI